MQNTNLAPQQTYPNLPADMTAPEAIMWFGQMLLSNFAPTRQYTVSEWIDHVIDTKTAAGRKRKTICGYRYCADRVNAYMGDVRICDIRPNDISDFFTALKKETISAATRATLKKGVDMKQILLAEGISKTRLATIAGISQSTIDNAMKGNKILWAKAEAIATALHQEPTVLFLEIPVEKKLSNDTMEDYRRFVSMIFSAAVRELQIPYNPVERAEKFRYRKKKAEILQPEDVQAVWEAAEQEPILIRCLVHMFLITGGRRGEIAGFRWTELNWNSSSIKINHEILYTPEDGVYCEEGTKNDRSRILRLPAETMELLKEYKRWQDQRKTELGERWIESDYIFTGRFGGPIHPDSISGYIDRFEERHCLPHLHPHKFRHTMASILIYSGVDTVTVSKRLGHAQVSTTQNTYAHLIQKADIESAECIADAIIRNKKIV